MSRYTESRDQPRRRRSRKKRNPRGPNPNRNRSPRRGRGRGRGRGRYQQGSAWTGSHRPPPRMQSDDRFDEYGDDAYNETYNEWYDEDRFDEYNEYSPGDERDIPQYCFNSFEECAEYFGLDIPVVVYPEFPDALRAHYTCKYKPRPTAVDLQECAKQYYGIGNECQLTGDFRFVETAHIFPRAMQALVPQEWRSDGFEIDAGQNLLRLRKDLHEAFDNLHVTFVAEVSLNGVHGDRITDVSYRMLCLHPHGDSRCLCAQFENNRISFKSMKNRLFHRAMHAHAAIAMDERGVDIGWLVNLVDISQIVDTERDESQYSEVTTQKIAFALGDYAKKLPHVQRWMQENSVVEELSIMNDEDILEVLSGGRNIDNKLTNVVLPILKSRLRSLNVHHHYNSKHILNQICFRREFENLQKGIQNGGKTVQDIEALQKYLKHFGFYGEEIDGEYGEVTAMAVNHLGTVTHIATRFCADSTLKAFIVSNPRCEKPDIRAPITKDNVTNSRVIEQRPIQPLAKRQIAIQTKFLGSDAYEREVREALLAVKNVFESYFEGFTIVNEDDERKEEKEMVLEIEVKEEDTGALGYSAHLKRDGDVEKLALGWGLSHTREKLVSLLCHYVGHLLGLEHSFSPGDVMYPYHDMRGVTLSDNDVRMMRELVGEEV